jgi:anti-sigma regulatory factor (Ser/Thr protein kinase)
MEKASAVASVTKSYPAIAEAVPLARAELGAFAAAAGASEEQLDNVRLVVSEAVTNAVQHAYPATPGEIHISAALVSDELWILIGDDGRGLRPASKSAGLGLGLVWMEQFSDGLTVLTRSCGGVEVRVRFDLPQLAGAEAHLRSGPRVARVC